MIRSEQLNKQIARLNRRADRLNEISKKYWTVRRIIFVSGALLALVFCNFAGRTVGWVFAAVLALLFAIVSVYHSKVRNSLTRNSLLIEIKQVQIARIRLDWDRIPPGDPTSPPVTVILLKAISISLVSVRCIV